MKTRNQIFTTALLAALLSLGSTLQADDQEKQSGAQSSASSSVQSDTQESQASSSESEPSSSLESESQSTISRSAEDSSLIEESAGAEADKLDKEFLKEAMKGAQMEIKMGEMASQKAQSQSVKQFGQKLAKDHRESNQKMEKIARQKGLTASSDLGKHQKHVDRLSSLSGSEFDRAFIEHAVKDHEKAVKKYQKQASEGEDPAIRSFASETLPTLQEHLRIAETLEGNANASIPELREPAGAETPDSQSQPDDSQPLEPEDDPGASSDDDTSQSGAASSSQTQTP